MKRFLFYLYTANTKIGKRYKKRKREKQKKKKKKQQKAIAHRKPSYAQKLEKNKKKTTTNSRVTTKLNEALKIIVGGVLEMK